jgi:GNAT superfamily N-acetyltransferase
MIDHIPALKEALLCARFENPGIRWIERPGWLQSFNKDGLTVYQNSVFLTEFAEETPPAEVARVVEETVREYAAAGLKFRWILGPWTRPPDLAAHLLRSGLAFGRTSFGMTAAAERVEMPFKDPRVDIVAVDARGADEWTRTFCEAWSIPEKGRDAVLSSVRNGLADESRRKYIALYDGAPAGIASAAFLKGSAYLYNSAVLPAYRLKGIFRALVAFRAEEARKRGCELLTIYAFKDTSFPILQKLGFETVCECPQYFFGRDQAATHS